MDLYLLSAHELFDEEDRRLFAHADAKPDGGIAMLVLDEIIRTCGRLPLAMRRPGLGLLFERHLRDEVGGERQLHG